MDINYDTRRCLFFLPFSLEGDREGGGEEKGTKKLFLERFFSHFQKDAGCSFQLTVREGGGGGRKALSTSDHFSLSFPPNLDERGDAKVAALKIPGDFFFFLVILGDGVAHVSVRHLA